MKTEELEFLMMGGHCPECGGSGTDGEWECSACMQQGWIPSQMQYHTHAVINGVRVYNFSSPHPFTFTDGTVLEACPEETSRAMSLEQREVETPHSTLPIIDISLVFEMSDNVLRDISILQSAECVDIILIPFPVMECLKKNNIPIGKCRVCRTADRIKKTVYSDRFCV